MFEEIRDFMVKLGLPSGDLNDLPTSNKFFDDGSSFKIEVPTVNSIQTLNALLDESEKLKIRINRVTETQGMFRYSKMEIEEWVKTSSNYKCELLMSVGPRATYDIGASVQSIQGRTIGYRLRGQEQLIRAIEDVKRGIDIGVKSFLVYDEGMLWVLNEMRNQKELPEDIKFKISAHCGHCNPASIKLLEQLGANSVNPVRDLSLQMLSAIRSAVMIPLDCHTDNPISSGGFVRVYEAPEIVRIASPVYLKTGNSVVGSHGSLTTAQDGKLMARQASIVLEMLEKYYPQGIQSF